MAQALLGTAEADISQCACQSPPHLTTCRCLLAAIPHDFYPWIRCLNGSAHLLPDTALCQVYGSNTWQYTDTCPGTFRPSHGQHQQQEQQQQQGMRPRVKLRHTAALPIKYMLRSRGVEQLSQDQPVRQPGKEHRRRPTQQPVGT